MDPIFEIESSESFETAINELLKRNHTSTQKVCTEIANNVFEAAKDDLRKLLFKTNFDINKLSEQLLLKKWDEERVKQFVCLLNETKGELFRSVLTHYNSAYGDTVTDSMWLLKYVLGTSESKVIRYPVVQLVLSTVNSNGHTKEKLYELNKDILSLFINNLERSLDV